MLEHIPKQYLPEEYGGSNGVIQDVIDHWEKKLLSYRDHFEDEKQYGTNEKLRPGKAVDAQSLFGIEGSFRKLEVDWNKSDSFLNENKNSTIPKSENKKFDKL